MSKPAIYSNIFLDIIDLSKRLDAEQVEVKKQFNHLVNNVLKDMAKEDCSILATANGATITYMGSPDRARIFSQVICDEVLKNNMHSLRPMHLRVVIDQHVGEQVPVSKRFKDVEKMDSMQMPKPAEVKTNWRLAVTYSALALPALVAFALLVWTAPSVMWLFR